jgi:hypothetical protein
MRAFVKKAFEKELKEWKGLIQALGSERLAHAMQKQKMR